MQESEEPRKSKLSTASFKSAGRILKYMSPYWLAFFFGLFLLTMSSLLTLVITRLWGQLGGAGTSVSEASGLDNFISISFDLSVIKNIAIIVFALLLVQAVISFLRVYVFARITENVLLTLRTDVYKKVVCMPMTFFNTQRVGDLNSRISADVTAIQDIFMTTLPELFRQFIIITFGIAFLIYSSPRLTLVMVSTLPVMVIVAVVFGRYIRKLSKQTQDKVAESNVIVQETFTGIVNVKSFANELFEIARYSVSAKEIKGFAMKGAIWRGLFSSFIIVFIFGAITLIIWQGSTLAESGQLDNAEFLSFLLLTGLVAGSIGGLAAQFGTLQRGLGAVENVMDQLEMEEEPITEISSETRGMQGDIGFRDVHFAYPSRSEIKVLKGITFDASHGQQIALVGASGSGKSTLASLVLRFYQPDQGQILIDGKDTEDLSLSELRNQMAFVPQEVLLFGGSIRENIAYGKPDATDQEIRDAAEKANALEFIDQFPEGMNTVVGERGIQLSGGQRQRIAIARAILKDPAILILDEATSALDSESERLVQEALDYLMKGRTSLVIAHRLSTIRNADKILVLEEGKIVEEGKHAELVQKTDGVYKHLSELQLEA